MAANNYVLPPSQPRQGARGLTIAFIKNLLGSLDLSQIAAIYCVSGLYCYSILNAHFVLCCTRVCPHSPWLWTVPCLSSRDWPFVLFSIWIISELLCESPQINKLIPNTAAEFSFKHNIYFYMKTLNFDTLLPLLFKNLLSYLNLFSKNANKLYKS